MENENLKRKEKSKGQIFKEKMGFSKTQKRLMDKRGLSVKKDSLEYLKTERKEKRHEKARITKEKHTTAKAKRKSAKPTK